MPAPQTTATASPSSAPARDALEECLELVAREAAGYLAKMDEALLRPAGSPDGIAGSLPDEGTGSLAALRTLVDAAEVGATRSAGPRFFHFVMGGGTPAALAADWLASALDQIAYNWVSSPLAMELEQVSVGWLKELLRAPAILVATAGEVDAGGFDPIADMADLAEEHGAWLHVDGAFGLFAAVSPATRGLVAGIERAHSVAVDGHKWLNVPYDCGAAYVHDPELHEGAFTSTAAYLGREELDRPVFGNLAPEMSRRARSLAVWATSARTAAAATGGW